MFATVLCLVGLLSSASAAALRPYSDGFSLEDVDGQRYFSYAVVPVHHGDPVVLHFYDVDFATNDCSDLRVDVYNNGYVKTSQDLVRTLCDAESLSSFVAESQRGFYISLASSNKTHRAQVRARFSAHGGFKVTRQVFHK